MLPTERKTHVQGLPPPSSTASPHSNQLASPLPHILLTIIYFKLIYIFWRELLCLVYLFLNYEDRVSLTSEEQVSMVGTDSFQFEHKPLTLMYRFLIYFNVSYKSRQVVCEICVCMCICECLPVCVCVSIVQSTVMLSFVRIARLASLVSRIKPGSGFWWTLLKVYLFQT